MNRRQPNTNLNTTNLTTPSEMIGNNGPTRFMTVSPTAGNRFYRMFKP
ncbi:MAG: hypothetical protein H7X97_06945 [Opitutaceae bacterium]|nr:hypothetical protein [Verrucomicrobiales bacterium]